MTQRRQQNFPEEPPTDRTEADTRAASLGALAVVIVLVAGALWLTGALRKTGDVQDCVMAGRNNCAPIESGSR